jgi:hypothetical protein
MHSATVALPIGIVPPLEARLYSQRHCIVSGRGLGMVALHLLRRLVELKADLLERHSDAAVDLACCLSERQAHRIGRLPDLLALLIKLLSTGDAFQKGIHAVLIGIAELGGKVEPEIVCGSFLRASINLFVEKTPSICFLATRLAWYGTHGYHVNELYEGNCHEIDGVPWLLPLARIRCNG